MALHTTGLPILSIKAIHSTLGTNNILDLANTCLTQIILVTTRVIQDTNKAHLVTLLITLSVPHNLPKVHLVTLHTSVHTKDMVRITLAHMGLYMVGLPILDHPMVILLMEKTGGIPGIQEAPTILMCGEMDGVWEA